MTVAFDAFTANAAQTADFNFSHNPVGTPRAVIVFLVQTGAGTDTIAGVTYGGAAMTEVSGSPNLLASGETGATYCYFLGSSVPTDDPATVAVDMTGSTSTIAYCITLTAANDCTVQDSDGTINSTSQANPSVTLSLSGKTSFAAIGIHSGVQTVGNITELTSWTARSETDRGATQAACYTYDTIDNVDVTAGWTQGSDDACAIAIAVTDVTNQAFERNISETVEISESLARTYNAIRSPSETVSVSETLTRDTSTFVRPISETVGVSETLDRNNSTFVRGLDETVAVSETVERVKGNPREISESVPISETVSTAGSSYTRGISETTGASETLDRSTSTFTRGISETTGVSESVATTRGAARDISESVSVSESIDTDVALTRNISETVAVGETVDRTLGANRLINETVAVSESISTSLGLTRIINETVSIFETLARVLGLTRGISESVGVSETLDVTYTPVGGGPPPTETKQFGQGRGRRLKRWNFRIKRL